MAFFAEFKRSDRVMLLAPAGAVEKKYVFGAAKIINDMGYTAIFGKSAFSSYGYLSAMDEVRAQDINEAFLREDVRGIFALRGGYGCARILDLIDYEAVRRNPKAFIGYSDITALFCALWKRAGLIGFHSFMPGIAARDGFDPYSAVSLKNALSGNAYEVENPCGRPMEFSGEGACEGILVGGNLSVLSSLCGTEYMPDCTGKILLLEETNEELYKVDRLLNQLSMCGILSAVSGFVIGGFTDILGEGIDISLYDLLSHYIFSTGKPAVRGVCTGHTDKKCALVIGGRYRIEPSARSFRFAGGKKLL